jgi:hypothetical protein
MNTYKLEVNNYSVFLDDQNVLTISSLITNEFIKVEAIDVKFRSFIAKFCNCYSLSQIMAIDEFMTHVESNSN